MAANKTQARSGGVTEFVKSIEDSKIRKDVREIMKMMREATGNRPKLWGPNIIGYGRYHYKYASGREGDFFLTGLSLRKRNITIYIVPGFKQHAPLMKKLGKHKHSKSCLYINSLDNVDRDLLVKLIKDSVLTMRERYECD